MPEVWSALDCTSQYKETIVKLKNSMIVSAIVIAAASLDANQGGTGGTPIGECVDPHAGSAPVDPPGCSSTCTSDTCDIFQSYNNFVAQSCENVPMDCILGNGPTITLDIQRYRCNTGDACANPAESKCYLTTTSIVQVGAASCP